MREMSEFLDPTAEVVLHIANGGLHDRRDLRLGATVEKRQLQRLTLRGGKSIQALRNILAKLKPAGRRHGGCRRLTLKRRVKSAPPRAFAHAVDRRVPR